MTLNAPLHIVLLLITLPISCKICTFIHDAQDSQFILIVLSCVYIYIDVFFLTDVTFFSILIRIPMKFVWKRISNQYILEIFESNQYF